MRKLRAYTHLFIRGILLNIQGKFDLIGLRFEVLKVKWACVSMGAFACLSVFYFPWLGWIFAPLIGGMLAGFMALSTFKQCALSGAIVGFIGATLWLTISAIHWGGWLTGLYTIGWISGEPVGHISYGIFSGVVLFFVMYIAFGFIGGAIGKYARTLLPHFLLPSAKA